MNKLVVIGAIAACLFLWTADSHAGVITFDEFAAYNSEPPYLTDEYAQLGIHFQTGWFWPDGTTYSGGTWGLTGTNGDQFLGFNGFANGMIVEFDHDVSAFSFDYTRGLGSRQGNVLYLLFNDGSLVDDGWLALPCRVNDWLTYSYSGESIDGAIFVVNYGRPGYRWGVDNMNFVQVSGDLPVPLPPSIFLLGSGFLFAFDFNAKPLFRKGRLG